MMKKLCAVMAAAAAMLLILSCGVMAENPDMTPAPALMGLTDITVQGTGVVNASPDIVTVTANASVTDTTVAGAQEKMSVIVESATAKLLELGVLGEDVVTSNYSYYPRYNYDTNEIIGYEANHTLLITCRDVEMLDSVIGVVTDSGLSQIYDVSYDVSNRSELYQQALELAIGAAESKALRMAQASGVTIMGLSSVTENSGYGDSYVVNATEDAGLFKSAAGSTGIRAGGVSVSARVTAVYEAEAAR